MTAKVSGKKLIRFNQCNCGRKEFCRMFGQDPSCDDVVPDYPDKPHSTGTEFQEDYLR
jgi:hypothetical protein